MNYELKKITDCMYVMISDRLFDYHVPNTDYNNCLKIIKEHEGKKRIHLIYLENQCAIVSQYEIVLNRNIMTLSKDNYKNALEESLKSPEKIEIAKHIINLFKTNIKEDVEFLNYIKKLIMLTELWKSSELDWLWKEIID